MDASTEGGGASIEPQKSTIFGVLRYRIAKQPEAPPHPWPPPVPKTPKIVDFWGSMVMDSARPYLRLEVGQPLY